MVVYNGKSTFIVFSVNQLFDICHAKLPKFLNVQSVLSVYVNSICRTRGTYGIITWGVPYEKAFSFVQNIPNRLMIVQKIAQM